MLYFWIFESLLLSMVAWNLWKLYSGTRKYVVDDVVWYRELWTGPRRPWQLVIVVKDCAPEHSTVYHVRTLDTDERHIVARCELRPIRWWQHDKVDPIVMKYHLLKEFP